MRDLAEDEKKFIKIIFNRENPKAPISKSQLEYCAEIGGFSGKQILDISTELERRGLIKMKQDPKGPAQRRTGGIMQILFTQSGVDCALTLM
jgi:hypothetical protein